MIDFAELNQLADKYRDSKLAQDLQRLSWSTREYVFQLSLKYLGDFEAAEDASQDIVVKILDKFGTFAFRSKFSTWVYSIAVHHLWNEKRKKLPLMLPLEDKHLSIPLKNSTATVAEDDVRLVCIHFSLQVLSSQERMVYILLEIVSLQSPEVAQIVGKPADTVRQIHGRSKKKLQRHLRGKCEFVSPGHSCKCIDALQNKQQHEDWPSHSQIIVDSTIQTSIDFPSVSELDKLDKLERLGTVWKKNAQRQYSRVFAKMLVTEYRQ
ncbi:MAG: RNA polymerase sigma factor [Spirochaetota bacterium]